MNLNIKREFYKLRLKYFSKKVSVHPSETKIDVIIPAIEKDLQILPYVIDGIRENVKHPIGKILIVSPEVESIKQLASRKNCVFINENSVLPITKKNIDYMVNGDDRSGWLFQQLIKLNGDEISSEDYYLVVDADTVLIRPQVFIDNGKVLFNCSDEYHLPYFITYRKLLSLNARFPLSFVSHHMLFERQKCKSLKKEFEDKNNTLWYQAIIDNVDHEQGSFFSEYETYGNYVSANFPEQVYFEYWFNLSLNQKEVKNLDILKKKYFSKYKSISFHHYKS